jgi:hypothetical protein
VEPTPSLDTEQIKVLTEAHQRARKLLEDLLRQQADLHARPPKHLDPQQTEAGRTAVQKAIDAARRTGQAVTEALQPATATLSPHGQQDAEAGADPEEHV